MSDAEARKKAVIGRPTKLPLSVAIQVAMGSIKVRLSRSLVTVSSVVLAVTFLLVVLGGEISSNAVHHNWVRDVRPAEDSSALRGLLVQPRTVLHLMRNLRDDPEGTRQWAASMGHELPEFTEDAPAQALVLAHWLESIRPSQRYLIVRNSTIGAWLLRYRADAEEMDVYQAGRQAAEDAANDVNGEESAQTQDDESNGTSAVTTDESGQGVGYGSQDRGLEETLLHYPRRVREVIVEGSNFTGTRLPMSNAELVALATSMNSLAPAIVLLQEAERQRLDRVQELGGADVLVNRFRQGEDAGEALAADGMPLNQLLIGIKGDAERNRELREQFEIEDLRLQVQQVLSATRIEESEDDQGNTTSEVLPPLPLGALVDGRLERHPHSEDIKAELQSAVGLEALGRVRHDILRRRTLEGLRATFTTMNYDPEEGKERTLWLVLLSLLVCVVGIVNSMMMAVTERFREIATMKCLGAMDSFILKTFMIESGSVGFVGSVLGAIIGVILVLAQATSRFGGSFWSAFPGNYLFLAAVASLLCGLVLTIIGALLPAYKAARMHPIEAMRLEA